MNTKVKDLMVSPVVSTLQHKSVGHAKDIMQKNNIQALPIVDSDKKIVGIVTPSNLLKAEEGSPISKIMTENVYTIPEYAPIQDAARIMRKHKIHHVLVAHEKELVGIISSFDLLKLVEDKAFVAKNEAERKKKEI